MGTRKKSKADPSLPKGGHAPVSMNEYHQTLGQTFAILSLRLQMLRDGLMESDPKAAEELRHLHTLLLQASLEARRLLEPRDP